MERDGDVECQVGGGVKKINVLLYGTKREYRTTAAAAARGGGVRNRGLVKRPAGVEPKGESPLRLSTFSPLCSPRLRRGSDGGMVHTPPVCGGGGAGTISSSKKRSSSSSSGILSPAESNSSGKKEGPAGLRRLTGLSRFGSTPDRTLLKRSHGVVSEENVRDQKKGRCMLQGDDDLNRSEGDGGGAVATGTPGVIRQKEPPMQPPEALKTSQLGGFESGAGAVPQHSAPSQHIVSHQAPPGSLVSSLLSQEERPQRRSGGRRRASRR